jgi:hypothetical protein
LFYPCSGRLKKLITSLDIAAEFVRHRGLKSDDATLVLIRKRVGACLTELRANGTVTEVPQPGEYKGWRLA